MNCRGLVLVAVLGSLLAAGCHSSSEEPAESVVGTAAESHAGKTVRLAVANDAPLAEAMRRMKGEWKTLTGGEFEVQSTTVADLVEERIRPDAVVYPSAAIGILAQRSVIRPLPEANRGDNRAVQPGLFDLLMLEEARWGKQRVAVSFGSPQFVLYYRADLFAKFGKEPPQDWNDYSELARFFQDRARLGDAAPPTDRPWSGTLEPWGDEWCGLTFLARAACYAKHPELYTGVFDIYRMNSQIAQPPFQRALSEMAEASRSGPNELEGLTPDACRAAFWRGECAMAISWPSAAARIDSPAPAVTAGVAPLPGSNQVFDLRDAKWEDGRREVPLLAMAGRLGSVTSTCPEDALSAALDLLAFLASAKSSPQVSAASAHTTLYLESQLARPELWVERPLQAQAAKYAEIVHQQQERTEYLAAIRIPGHEVYVQAISEACQAVLKGEQSEQVALRLASQRLNEITRILDGRPQSQASPQLQAYHQSLGLLPWSSPHGAATGQAAMRGK